MTILYGKWIFSLYRLIARYLNTKITNRHSSSTNFNICPKITIVTPSLNQGKYLEQTILSVLSQEYPNLEYIIIDGGSTDNSLEVIKKYEDKLHYWISEPDKGLYDAIQKGFEQSTGEIMGWINSDDLYHPNALNMVADIFQHFTDIKWLTGAPTKYDELGRVTDVQHPLRWSKYMYCRTYKISIQQESTFWHRDLWKKCDSTLNTNLRYAGDYDLFIRFFKYEKLYAVPTLIGGFRERAANQLSLEGLNKYHSESKSILRQVKKQLTLKEKMLTYLIVIDKVITAIPILKNLYFKLKLDQRLFSYPKKLIFNRLQQKFVLSE